MANKEYDVIVIGGGAAGMMAAGTAAGNIENFIYVAMNSIYHVALTFIGQNVGARKFKNIRRLTVYSALIVTAIGVGCGALLLIFRYPLIHLYVQSDEAVAAAMMRFTIIIPTYFLCGLMDVFCGGLRALDRSVTAMVISLCGACGFRILWIMTVFRVYNESPLSVYISYPISWALTAGCHLLFMIFAAKKPKRVTVYCCPLPVQAGGCFQIMKREADSLKHTYTAFHKEE